MSKLNFNCKECELLAHALNSCKVGNYSPEQREALPALGRKLAEYLADPNAEKRIYKNRKRRKPEKELVGFTKVLAEDTEYQQMRANLNASIEPSPIVIIDDRPPLPDLSECEAVYATLRGKHNLNKLS